MVMVWIRDSGQTKIANLEIAGGVEEQIRRLQIAMQNVGGVNVLEAAKNLVQEVTDVVVAQALKYIFDIREHNFDFYGERS